MKRLSAWLAGALLAAPLLLLTTLASAVPPAAATPSKPPAPTGEAAEPPPEDSGPRTLSGHTFVPMLQSSSPFVATSFGFAQGFAFVNLPNLAIPGTDRTVDLSFAGLAETLQLAVALHERFGLVAAVNGTAISGVNGETVLFVGAQAETSGILGANAVLLRLPETGTQVGAVVSGSLSAGRTAAPLNLIAALLANPEQTVETILDGDFARLLITEQTTFGGALGLSAAQALGPHVGVQLATDASLGWTNNRSFDGARDNDVRSYSVDFGFGGALGGNAMPYVPIALQAEYRLDLGVYAEIAGEPEDAAEPRHTLAAGLYYTGRKELLLGVQGATILQTDAQQRTEAFLGQLAMAYFF
jgi:hypothetical protein